MSILATERVNVGSGQDFTIKFELNVISADDLNDAAMKIVKATKEAA
jgi:hypothetical protein